jgi:dolichyl-phosphate beta-glucosyltransferase
MNGRQPSRDWQSDWSLSVVLPAYNESHRLPATLAAIRPYLDAHFREYEVIVVDDGSVDRTPEVVQGFQADWPKLSLLVQPHNQGKGAAVRRGCLAANCDLMLFMDADLATPIEEIEGMLPHLEHGSHGAVVGVRTYQEDESKWRRVLGLTLQMLAHLVVFEKAVVDSQCGFKCFTRIACREVFSRSRIAGGMFDVELFFIMHRLGIPVYYEPVHWKNKPGSTINLLRCMLFDPFDLIRIRVNGMLGRYEQAANDWNVAAVEGKTGPRWPS